MKKQLLQLTFLGLILFSNRISAQAFNTSVTPQGLCQNSNAMAVVTATQPLAAFYTWAVAAPGFSQVPISSAAPNGSTALITFTACGTHTVYCFAFTSGSIQVNSVTNLVTVACNSAPSPTIATSAINSTLCSGNSVTLTGLGGSTYTWFPGNLTGSSIVVTPTSNACYTLVASNANSCNSMSTSCLNVFPSPTLVVSGNGTVCAGGSLTLALMGALTYTLAPPGIAVGGSVIITPTVTTNYTLDGCGFTCCAPTTVFGATVMPAPNLFITGSNSVCSGSSINFTATGASSYTWNTSPAVNTNTLSLIPTASFTYMAYGTGTNGCVGFASIANTVNSNCAIVWPGDANRDGAVSNTDVLELGLAANNTGPARTPTSNAWNGQYAAAWTGTVSSGWNKAHADCNGDGIINASDNAAITQNFGLTHSFKENHVVSANPDIHLVAPVAPIFAGNWNKADIHLGDANNSISQVYGIAYEVLFDQALVQTDSVKIIYTPSFLNASNQNIDFGKVVFANSKLYAATVRVDHGDVSGNGKIGEFWYKVSNTVPLNSALNLSIANAMKVNSAGITGSLSTGSSSVAISNSGVGFNEISLLENSVSIYPNPTAHLLTLQNNSVSGVTYTLTDILGREVLKGEFVGLKALDVSALQQGAYFIQFECAGMRVHKKLVIEKP